MRSRFTVLAILAWSMSATAQPSSISDFEAAQNERVEPQRQAQIAGAMLQTDLERIAAGKAPTGWSYPERIAPLARISVAYAAMLRADVALMDAIRGEVHASAESTLAQWVDEVSRQEHARQYLADRATVIRERAAANAASAIPLQRMQATVELVGVVLFALQANSWSVSLETHSISRPFVWQSSVSTLDGFRLRLPCRTLRAKAGETPPRNVPAGAEWAYPSDSTDPVELAALASDPASAAPASRWRDSQSADEGAVYTPSAAEFARAQALRLAATEPDAAIQQLRGLATTSVASKLDLALLLHAVRPPSTTRDAEVDRLTTEVTAAMRKGLPDSGRWGLGPEPGGGQSRTSEDLPPTWRYDGTDDSLIRLVATVSYLSGDDAESEKLRMYAIPCTVLIRRPALINALEPIHGSSRDGWVPLSGCDEQAPEMRAFPWRELSAYLGDAEAASGYFIDRFDGTAKYSYIALQRLNEATVKADPTGLVANQQPVPDMLPYQAWGVLGPYNWRVYTRIERSATRLRIGLARYYRAQHGLSRSDAHRAAHRALFLLVSGADCAAGAKPGLRGLILGAATPDHVIAWRAEHGDEDDPALDGCARFAGKDPILHLAATRPRLLPAFIADGVDVDVRNELGKTPLMVSVQADAIRSVRLLLAAGADVNARTGFTWLNGMEPRLANDGRTPLMYAAAEGSLATIRLLLQAGADPFAADSKGRRAIDYLLGYGPVPPNTRLSARQRRIAVGMLF